MPNPNIVVDLEIEPLRKPQSPIAKPSVLAEF